MAGFNTSSVVGNVDLGNVIYPFPNNTYTGELVNYFYSAFISIQIQPFAYLNYGTKAFQYKFIIEYN